MNARVVLRGITWAHDRGLKPLVATVPEYLEGNDELEVVWDTRSLFEFGEGSLETLADEYDVLVIDHPFVGEAAKKGLLAPIDAYLAAGDVASHEADAVGRSATSYRADDHLWALAIDAAAHVSAYRRDLLDASVQTSLPRSWESVIELAEAVARQGLRTIVPIADVYGYLAFLTIYSTRTGPPFADGLVALPSEGAEALAILRQLVAIAGSPSARLDPVGALEALATEDLVAYCPITFGYSNYARGGYRPYLVQFTEIPGNEDHTGAVLGGTGFAVSRRSSRPELAVAYGQWLVSPRVQAGPYVRHGGQPASRSAWVDEHANAITNGFFHDTLATLEGGWIRPRFDGYIRFQAIAADLIHEHLAGQLTAEETLGQLNEGYGRRRAGHG